MIKIVKCTLIYILYKLINLVQLVLKSGLLRFGGYRNKDHKKRGRKGGKGTKKKVLEELHGGCPRVHGHPPPLP